MELDTKVAGIGVLVGGVAALGGAAGLFYADYRYMRGAQEKLPRWPSTSASKEPRLALAVRMQMTLKRLSRLGSLGSLPAWSCGAAAVLSLASAGCTRVTSDSRTLDEECKLGQFCALPASECTSGTVIRGGSRAVSRFRRRQVRQKVRFRCWSTTAAGQAATP